jgi:hypothetical protein
MVVLEGLTRLEPAVLLLSIGAVITLSEHLHC